MKRRTFLMLMLAFVLSMAMCMVAFAGDMSYTVTSGKTGKTATWVNPKTGDEMDIPVVTSKAKITIKGNEGQPDVNPYTIDGEMITSDGFMADFSVYPSQEIDIADVLDRLSSKNGNDEWRADFPDEWVYFVEASSGMKDLAFYVSDDYNEPDDGTDDGKDNVSTPSDATPSDSVNGHYSGGSGSSSGGSSHGSSSSGSASGPGATTGSWIQNEHGWWFKNTDGSWPSNNWLMINNKWYYFNSEGYMTTGWQLVNGKWYYMTPNGDMTTGWQLINEKWYYMDSSGTMLSNTTTPDGYVVDDSGAWNGSRVL